MQVLKLRVVGSNVTTFRRRHCVAMPPQPLEQVFQQVRVFGVDQLELFREEHDMIDECIEVRVKLQLD